MLAKLVGVLAVVASSALVGAKALTADGLPTVYLPLTVSGGNLDMIYTIPVHVGGQKFNLTLDTNSPWTVLFADGFKPYSNACDDGGQRNLFNTTLSRTYIPGIWHSNVLLVTRQPLIPYISGRMGTDNYALDSVSSPVGMKSLRVSEVPFFLVSSSNYALNPGWASDGVFPLTMKGGNPAISDILDAVGGRQEITLWLNGRPNEGGESSPGGQITLGGHDVVHCGDAKAKWQKISATDNWSVNLVSVTAGTYTAYNLDQDARIPISVASPMLIVPKTVFDGLIGAFGAEYNFELDLYTVDCADVASLPGVTISIGYGIDGLNYTVPVENFVTKVKARSGLKCTLLIVDGVAEWAIGSRFLPQRCMHLDYSLNKISFAVPK